MNTGHPMANAAQAPSENPPARSRRQNNTHLVWTDTWWCEANPQSSAAMKAPIQEDILSWQAGTPGAPIVIIFDVWWGPAGSHGDSHGGLRSRISGVRSTATPRAGQTPRSANGGTSPKSPYRWHRSPELTSRKITRPEGVFGPLEILVRWTKIAGSGRKRVPTVPTPFGPRLATLFVSQGQECQAEMQLYTAEGQTFARWRYEMQRGRDASEQRIVEPYAGSGWVDQKTGRIWWAEWYCHTEQTWQNWFEQFVPPKDCTAYVGCSAPQAFREHKGEMIFWGGGWGTDATWLWTPDPSTISDPEHVREVNEMRARVHTRWKESIKNRQLVVLGALHALVQDPNLPFEEFERAVLATLADGPKGPVRD